MIDHKYTRHNSPRFGLLWRCESRGHS
jgi:hypothetical protein